MPVLAETENVIIPFPMPLLPDNIVNHDESLIALLQLQLLADEETATLPVPPADDMVDSAVVKVVLQFAARAGLTKAATPALSNSIRLRNSRNEKEAPISLLGISPILRTNYGIFSLLNNTSAEGNYQDSRGNVLTGRKNLAPEQPDRKGTLLLCYYDVLVEALVVHVINEINKGKMFCPMLPNIFFGNGCLSIERRGQYPAAAGGAVAEPAVVIIRQALLNIREGHDRPVLEFLHAGALSHGFTVEDETAGPRGGDDYTSGLEDTPELQQPRHMGLLGQVRED
jgi:hypothetical protein